MSIIDPYAEREKIRALRQANLEATLYPGGHTNEMGQLAESANGSAPVVVEEKAPEKSLEELRNEYKELTDLEASPKWSKAQVENAIGKARVEKEKAQS
jgi:hypothetical protein